jgi:putative ABC transport system permease protein
MFFKLLRESFLFAVNSVVVNKLRTFLSLFGITIGIFSIISVFTVIDWMEKAIHDSIATLGDNVVYVQKWPWSFDPNLAWWDIMKWPAISTKDYEAVIDKSTKAETACFYVYQPQNLKYRKNQANEAAVVAVTHEFENLRSFEIGNGRYFSPEESASGKNVAIIGYEVANRLFDQAEPVGKQIIIGGNKANVIGVFKKEGKGGIGDSGMDEVTP